MLEFQCTNIMSFYDFFKSVNNVHEIYIFTVKKVKIFRFKDYNRERNIKGSERI